MSKLFANNIGWKAIVNLERLGFMKIANEVVLLVSPTEYPIGCSSCDRSWDSAAVDGKKMETIFEYIMDICDKKSLSKPMSACVSRSSSSPTSISVQYDRKYARCPRQRTLRRCGRFRSHNGLLMLMHLISNDEKNSDRGTVNDVLIREAACDALIGLARCEDIRQMLSKLPLVGGYELLATKKTYQASFLPEQELFYKQAKTLVEKVKRTRTRRTSHRANHPVVWCHSSISTSTQLHGAVPGTRDAPDLPKLAALHCRLVPLYSRFAPHKTFHNKDGAFMSCAFSADDEHILLGTFKGELLWYNISTEDVGCRLQCHTGSPLNEIISSSVGRIAAVDLDKHGFIVVNLVEAGKVPKLASTYSSASHARFSNTSNQYAVTTSDDYAKVYDLESESVVVQFKEGSTTAGHPYQRNIAMFDFKDTMLMSNGVLLILNTEVYDLRNYRLMHHVPILDDAKIGLTAWERCCTRCAHDPEEEDNTVFKPQVTTLNAKNFEIIVQTRSSGTCTTSAGPLRGKDSDGGEPHDDEHDNSDDEDLFNDSDHSMGPTMMMTTMRFTTSRKKTTPTPTDGKRTKTKITKKTTPTPTDGRRDEDEDHKKTTPTPTDRTKRTKTDHPCTCTIIVNPRLRREIRAQERLQEAAARRAREPEGEESEECIVVDCF
ncbi:hypothetical protein L596_017035 [Steinernema carpocapsae]|uniref:LisH domain-containing protein n=1 Tax=Steinernema carpocapsae TaxID=34508 RepID=A0A4U5N159_STECR|nr:hypothetical protein L596_017035 [Steinernema carpocapsae]